MHKTSNSSGSCHVKISWAQVGARIARSGETAGQGYIWAATGLASTAQCYIADCIILQHTVATLKRRVQNNGA